MAKKKRPKKLGAAKIDEIEEEYGLAYALFRAFPELEGLLGKAIKNAWTAQKFQVELRQTNWYKNHSDIWRKNTALKYSDPKTYNERLQNMRTGFNNIAATMGVNLSRKTFTRLAERAFMFGWDEGQIRDVLSKYVKPTPAGNYGGQLAAAQNNLETLAARNGVRVNKATMRKWMRQLARGDGSEEQFSNYIRGLAANTFRPYAEQIRAGSDVADIATPYIETMAQTLELNPNGIDLFDPTIRRVLSGQRDKQTKDWETPSITEFEDSLRRDPRWQFTQTAQDQARGYVSAIKKMWGM